MRALHDRGEPRFFFSGITHFRSLRHVPKTDLERKKTQERLPNCEENSRVPRNTTIIVQINDLDFRRFGVKESPPPFRKLFQTKTDTSPSIIARASRGKIEWGRDDTPLTIDDDRGTTVRVKWFPHSIDWAF